MSTSGTLDWTCATEKNLIFGYLLASAATLLALIIWTWIPAPSQHTTAAAFNSFLTWQNNHFSPRFSNQSASLQPLT